MTYDELMRDAADDLRDQLDGKDPSDEDTDRMIHEIADSTTPIYDSDILDVASSRPELALTEPACGPARDGSATPINFIVANIYEALTATLHETLDEIKEKWEESRCEHCGMDEAADTFIEDSGISYSLCEDCLASAKDDRRYMDG